MKSVINFSIIIPCHNSSSFIEPLLKSIPNRSDLEVILVDDYSSPEELEVTRSIFNTYSYGRRQFHTNTGVNSAGAARNVGIANASGKWLIFSDSDDHFTEEFGSILDKNLSSEADVLYFRPASDSKKGDYLDLLYDDYAEGVISEQKLAYEHRSPWSKIIKRSIVKDNDILYETSKNANDILFGAKVAFFAKTILIQTNETIYFYSERPGALTDYRNRNKYDIKINELVKRNLWLKENLQKNEFKKYRESAASPCVGAIRRYGLVYTINIYRKMRKNSFSIKLPKVILNSITKKLFRRVK